MQWLLIVLFLVAANVWAGEVTLLHRAEETKVEAKAPEPVAVKIAAKKKGPDRDFEQMKVFLRQENKRLKAIKLLHLDLERADLELRKREIEEKMAALGGSSSPIAAKSLTSGERAELKVHSILLLGSNRQALMSVDGRNIQVKEGQVIREGVVVKKIEAATVTVEDANGKQETIHFGA